jgi:hypothetical protein
MCLNQTGFLDFVDLLADSNGPYWYYGNISVINDAGLIPSIRFYLFNDIGYSPYDRATYLSKEFNRSNISMFWLDLYNSSNFLCEYVEYFLLFSQQMIKQKFGIRSNQDQWNKAFNKSNPCNSLSRLPLWFVGRAS